VVKEKMDKVANTVRDANFINKLHRMAEIFPKISELNIDTNKVLEKIVKIAAEVFETDVLVLFRYDERTKKIILPPIYNGDIKHKGALEAEAICLEVPLVIIKGGKSHYADHSQEDPLITSQGKPLPDGIQSRFVFRENILSSAGIILRVGQEIVGVMFINYRTPHEFNADERQLIEIFASYIAIAIQNVKHFSEKKLADVMHAISKITSIFAHKLKNDIATINLYTGALIEEVKPKEPQYFPLKQIKDKISKIKADIDQINKTTKLYIQEKKLIDIKDVISELESEILPDLKIKKIELEIQISPDIPEIELDPNQIKLVLWNLAMNSIEAMPGGGKISISISKLKENILIEWTDSGIGIPPENSQKIFDVFWTTKAQGYGLGLFHAKAIIEEHRGSISLDPNYRKGARFLIELPLKHE
jgi:signal transduction histidine kinase